MDHPRTTAEIVERALARTVDVEELCQETLDRISAQDAPIGSFRNIQGHDALAAAAELRTRIERGETELPLAGVPVAIKDNVAQRGHSNPAGRRDGPVATDDALVVARLKRAGALIVGRTNMDELAYGVTGENAHTGQVINPWKRNHHPGGSSAGSAAAVAAGLVPLAVGTDTAGSVRIPAALCGLVGIRPTRGVCSTVGIAPLSRSMDSVGPIAASVTDAALLLSVMADDPALADAPRTARIDLHTLRATAIRGRFAVDVDPGIGALFDRTIVALADLGVQIADKAVPEMSLAPRAAGPIIGAEAAVAWANDFALHPEWFGDVVSTHLKKGASLTAVRYLRACDERCRVAQVMDDLLDATDVLLLPTTAATSTPTHDPGPQLQFLALTTAFSLSGHPAITVPMGLVDGLPAGFQIVGGRRAEAVLLRLAHMLTEKTGTPSKA